MAARKNPTSYETHVPTEAFGGTHLKFTTAFDRGGINYFDYKTDPRGYWLFVTPVEVSTDGPFRVEKYSPFNTRRPGGGGRRLFLKSAERFNHRTLTDIARAVIENKAELAALFIRGDHAAVMRRARELAGADPVFADARRPA